jgi:predicted RecB family nuclease
VLVSLEGTIRSDEMHQFVEQSVAAIRDLAQQGKAVRALADLRQFRTTSPEATEVLRQGQQAAMQAGMTRIAELVSSEVAALQRHGPHPPPLQRRGGRPELALR